LFGRLRPQCPRGDGTVPNRDAVGRERVGTGFPHLFHDFIKHCFKMSLKLF